MNFNIPVQFQHFELSVLVSNLLHSSLAVDMNVRKFTKKRLNPSLRRSQFATISPAFIDRIREAASYLHLSPKVDRGCDPLQVAETRCRCALRS